jgi:hypothetical protein
MKFVCMECDRQMDFSERAVPGDGTFSAAFRCPSCGRSVALLANPMETQMVSALGVKVGGRTLSAQPFEAVRGTVQGRDDAFIEAPAPAAVAGRPAWSAAATERLANVPTFVRGMVKRIYAEYAAERGIADITPEVMDRARTELGLEGM